jgi:SAM-dependent methyltransferase
MSMEAYGQLASEIVALPADRLLHRCRWVLGPVEPAGKRILEIGAGAGVVSGYAVVAGAERVEAIEPELAGSSDGYLCQIQKLADRLDSDRLNVLPCTFQDYRDEGPFDLVVMDDSINHLDEPACQKLHCNDDARDVYVGLFRKLHDLLAPGGRVIICDCGRRNFWPAVGLRNPICGSIEWHKHQQPRLWASLLAGASLRVRQVRWTPLHRLRRLGRVAGNGVVSYFLTSHFRLLARRED